jgi:hypothetical protein
MALPFLCIFQKIILNIQSYHGVNLSSEAFTVLFSLKNHLALINSLIINKRFVMKAIGRE